MSEANRSHHPVVTLNDTESDARWPSPKSPIPVQLQDAQVWQLHADIDRPVAPIFLSAEERARADRFRHPPSRAQFIAARSALRMLLAANLNTTPDALHFATTPHGKPTLPDAPHLAFNVSHSAGQILVALQHGGQIGVDLEEITPNPEIHEIAHRMFHPDEQAHLLASPAKYSLPTFFQLWSRKEAILKADGRGLSLPSRSFSTLRPSVQIDATTFYLYDLPLAPTHATAVATSIPSPNLRYYRFPTVSLPYLS